MGSEMCIRDRFDPAESGGTADVQERQADIQDFSLAATMVEQAHEESEGPSIEDDGTAAEKIVDFLTENKLL